MVSDRRLSLALSLCLSPCAAYSFSSLHISPASQCRLRNVHGLRQTDRRTVLNVLIPAPGGGPSTGASQDHRQAGPSRAFGCSRAPPWEGTSPVSCVIPPLTRAAESQSRGGKEGEAMVRRLGGGGEGLRTRRIKDGEEGPQASRRLPWTPSSTEDMARGRSSTARRGDGRSGQGQRQGQKRLPGRASLLPRGTVMRPQRGGSIPLDTTCFPSTGVGGYHRSRSRNAAL